MLRTRAQKIKDFIFFPLRALTLIESDRWGLSSLASERFDYSAGEVTGYCLDIGCGKNNRFMVQYLGNNGKGIDVYPYVGLTEENIVKDMTKLPFSDGSFKSATFIANINHIPRPQRDAELVEAYRILEPGGNIILTMGNPLAELIIHQVLYFYDKFLGTSVDMDTERGMHEDEEYYLTDREITGRLSQAGFKDIRKKYFLTQWGLNHLFVGWKK